MSDLHYRNFEAIAFDFDGTLANTVPLHRQARLDAYAQIAEETGDERYALVPEEVQNEAHMHGTTPAEINGWVLKTAGIIAGSNPAGARETRAITERKSYVYSVRMAHGAPAVEGAVEYVRDAHARLPGQLGVVTTARRDTELVPFLRRYDLNSELPARHLVTHSDVIVEELKPHPRAYEIIMERLHVSSPERLLVLEDSPKGIEAGKKAGATVLAIATEFDVARLRNLQGYQQPDGVAASFGTVRSMTGV